MVSLLKVPIVIADDGEQPSSSGVDPPTPYPTTKEGRFDFPSIVAPSQAIHTSPPRTSTAPSRQPDSLRVAISPTQLSLQRVRIVSGASTAHTSPPTSPSPNLQAQITTAKELPVDKPMEKEIDETEEGSPALDMFTDGPFDDLEIGEVVDEPIVHEVEPMTREGNCGYKYGNESQSIILILYNQHLFCCFSAVAHCLSNDQDQFETARTELANFLRTGIEGNRIWTREKAFTRAFYWNPHLNDGQGGEDMDVVTPNQYADLIEDVARHGELMHWMQKDEASLIARLYDINVVLITYAMLILAVVVLSAFVLSLAVAQSSDQPAASTGGSSYYDTFTKKTYYTSSMPQDVCAGAKGCIWKNEDGYNGCYCSMKPKSHG